MGACASAVKQADGAAPAGKKSVTTTQADGSKVTITPDGEIECVKSTVFTGDQDALVCPIFEILECSYGLTKNLPHDAKLKEILMESFVSEVGESEIPEDQHALRESYKQHIVQEEHRLKQLTVPCGALDLKYTPVSAFEGGVQSHQRILRVKYKQV